MVVSHDEATNDSQEQKESLEVPKQSIARISSHAHDEDEVIDEIAKEEQRDALDDLYEKESEHEEPMLVIGDERHKWLAKLRSLKFWLWTSGLLFLVAVFVWLITPARLFVLNVAGQRVQVHISTVVPATEGTPPILKNATVIINNKEYRTDDRGTLNVALPYGDTRIVVSKSGYESTVKNEILDFDPFLHLLGGKQADDNARNLTFAMKNIGLALKFEVHDWLTAQPVAMGTFTVGDVEATPNSDGIVTMTVPATDAKEVPVLAKFANTFADTTLQVSTTSGNQKFALVNAGRDYFISKRTGSYGVYSCALDGSNVTEVVPSSVNETGDIAFSISPSGKYGVLASTRNATKDGVGSLQQKLFIVDLTTNKIAPVDTALTFNLVDWTGDTIVYTASEHGAGNAMNGRIASVDTATGKQTTLASVSGLKVARVSLSSVVYLTDTSELRTVRIKGGGDKSLGTGVTQFVQTDTDKFAYKITDGTWHLYNVNADQVGGTNTPTTTNRAFLAYASGDGQTQLVIDTIDGKPTLIAKKIAGGQENSLFAGSGLAGPIRWVGNVALYRYNSADYVVSPGGGPPKKVSDVSVTPLGGSNDYFELN